MAQPVIRISFIISIVVAAALTGSCTAALYPELQAAKSAGSAIFVSALSTRAANKRGYIAAVVQFFNTSPKTYKYVDIHVIGFNRVGDPIVQQNDQTPVILLRFTGPLPPRRTPGAVVWPKAWHLTAVSCLDIRRIDIQHMDGTSTTLQGPVLLAVLAKKLTRGCPTASR